MKEMLLKAEEKMLQVASILTIVRLNPDEELFLERERLLKLAEDLADQASGMITGGLAYLEKKQA